MVFLAGLVLLAENWFPQQVNVVLYLFMVLFLAVVTSVVHLVLLKVSQGKPQRFIRVFMLSTMIKLLLYLIFILAVAFSYREQAAGLLIAFLAFYIGFTALEVIFLRKHLDSQRS